MTQTTAEVKDHSISNKEDLKPILHHFYHWEKTRPNQVYLRQPQGDQWKEYTWQEVGNQVRRMAAAIKAMDLPAQSKIGIVSKNCAHWLMSDLAIMMTGHVSVPFYPTLLADKLNQVLTHSECKVLFIGKLDDWPSMKDGIPESVHCITFPDSPAEQKGYRQWDDLIAAYQPMAESPMPTLEDLQTIVYTSGTTGMPKGVMHSYFRMGYAIHNASDLLKLNGEDNRFFSYLPLCHIAERGIVETASLYSGGTVSFVESLESFAKNLAEVQPTHFLAVPRIWMKFKMGVLDKMPQKKLDTFLKIPILSGIVKNRIKKTLGLAKTKLTLTGAAPMPPSLLEWYQKLGITVQEAYGMTENGGCCTIMRKDKIKIGTVGQAYPNCQLKIDEKTGEVLMKSEWVMEGYFKEPGKTAETIKDGWLHTGDMGEIDQEGFLKITGRVKDQFKTAKGEFIVPGPIEEGYATNNYVEQICVVGRGLPQPVALVVLSESGQKRAREEQAEVAQSLEATRKSINANLVNYERIQKVIVAREPWSIENNMLTPTLKIKRNVMEEVYGNKLEGWYEKSDHVIWED